MPPIKRRLAEAGLVYAAAVWGSTFFLVKQTLADVDALALIGYRFTLSAVLLAAWYLLTTARKAGWRTLFGQFRAGLTLGVLLALLYIAQTVGLLYTTASNSGFITGLFVVFIPPIGWVWLKKRVRLWEVGAVLLAALGLFILTTNFTQPGLGFSALNIGDVITLMSAVTYALHVIIAGRYMARGLDPVALCFQQMLVTALLAWLALGVMGAFGLGSAASGSWLSLLSVTSNSAIWAILFLALVPTLSAFLIQLYAQKIVDATRTGLILVLEPVFAALFAWTIGRELFRPLGALGGLLIIAAMIISEVRWDSLRGSKSSEASTN